MDDALRAKGYGSRILKMLRRIYSDKRLFLAREQLDDTADNREERIHRRDFYMRNGFSDMGVRLREGPVIYDVMGIGGKVSPAEYDKLIRSWAGEILYRVVKMEIIE